MQKLLTKNRSLDKKGQSSLEVLIALTIMVLTITAAIVVGFGNQSAVLDTELHSKALRIAEKEIETLRKNARYDFSSIASSTQTEGIFTKEIIVRDTGTYSKEIDVKISWQLSPIQLRDLTLNTIITDWRTAWEQSGTGDGGGGLTGDWLNPETAGLLDLGPGNEGTDIAIREQTIFITGIASDIKKNDLFSINVSNINAPSMIASIDTGSGFESIALWNEYAYLAHKSNSEQIHVVNVSSPSNMFLVATSSLSSNSSLPKTVFAKDDYLYIGTESSASGTEIQIFDVSSPSNPSFEEGIEIGATVNDLFVFKNRLYAATSKSDSELIIFDVTDPNNPSQIGSYNATSTGRSVYATSFSTAYFGMGSTFGIMNTSNLSNISLSGTLAMGGNINDLYARDELAFVATSNNNAEFKVVNVQIPGTPTLQSEFNFPQVATGITYRDNVVYVSVRSNDALRIITSSQ